MLTFFSRIGVVASLAVASLACSSTIESVRTGTTIPVTRLSPHPGSFLYYSGLQQPERLAIRDQAAWVAAWRSLWPNGMAAPALPAVDFSKDMIVIAALGGRSTGGYSIFVDSARATASGLVVFIGTSSPGRHCVTTQAFTQPVDIARMPRTDAAVAFVDVPRVEDCQ